MKHLYLFIVFLILLPSTILAQDFDELSAHDIANMYDIRASSDKGGYNSYQKIDYFIYEYNIQRERITTFYENMDINQAYESYIKTSDGKHFENHNSIAERCKLTMWPTRLPQANKKFEWHYDNDLACDGVKKNEQWLDNTLEYEYKNPKQITVKYHAYGSGYYYHPLANELILEFKQDTKGTYLTMTSKALPVSFDCKKAGNAIEKAICSASEKGNFNEDAKLNYMYKGLFRELLNHADDTNTNNLKSAQIAWIKKRNQCKSDINCIKQSYKARYNELANQLKEIYSATYGLNDCTYLHRTHYDGTLQDTEFSTYKICKFKGDVIQSYEAIIKKYNNISKYFSSIEQIKQKKNIRNDVDSPTEGGIYRVNYTWKNDALQFSLGYEYGGTIFSIYPKNGMSEIIIKEYDIP